MTKATLVVLSALLTFAACKTPSDDTNDSNQAPATARSPDEEPPNTEQPPEASPATTEETGDFTPVKIPGTPHNEEHTRVTLTWVGESSDVPVYRSPGVHSNAVGKVKMKKGESFDYADSVVLVKEALPLNPRDGAELQGASAFTPSAGELAQGIQNVKLTPESDVYLLLYAGEGTCYYKVDSDYYLATCPSEEDFDADADFSETPQDSEWWIRLETARGSGWMEVDQKIDVDVESTM